MTDQPSTPSSPAPRPRRRRAAAPAAEVAHIVGDVETRHEAPADHVTTAEPAPAVASVATPMPPAGALTVEVIRGPIGGIRADEVQVRTGVVGGIAAGRAGVELGYVTAIAARSARFSRSIVRSVVAQDVRFEQSFARSVVANRVETGPATGIAFVVARHVDGDARILFDWRGGLALGMMLGVFAALFRVVRRRG